MIYDAIDLLFIFGLAVFLGFEVISKVPSILHTPLMSGSNAIHGIILVGAMAIASEAHGALQTALAFVAVFLATLNIVGGVVVTDRMLDMFKGRQQGRPGQPSRPTPPERSESVAIGMTGPENGKGGPKQ